MDTNTRHHLGCTDVFRFDDKFQEHEDRYRAIKRGILGESSDEDESGSEDGRYVGVLFAFCPCVWQGCVYFLCRCVLPGLYVGIL